MRTRPAPAFELIDQAGRPGHASPTFTDRVLVVDFIFTECPGPCARSRPTRARRISNAGFPSAGRDAGVHFVSISLDPETDRPEVLERYALERGADLSSWSFLTGEPEHVAEVVRAWGIGSVRAEDGSIDHTLITFLVKDGRVMERYTMEDARDDTLLSDIVALASPAAAS